MAVPPSLPNIPPKLDQECRDPGVGPVETVSQAVGVIGDQRTFAACANRKHRDTKAFYRGVQNRYAK